MIKAIWGGLACAGGAHASMMAARLENLIPAIRCLKIQNFFLNRPISGIKTVNKNNCAKDNFILPFRGLAILPSPPNLS
jgi:hypothetical protein